MREIDEVIFDLAEILSKAIVPDELKYELITVFDLAIDYYVADGEKRSELRSRFDMIEAFESEYNRQLHEFEIECMNKGIAEGIAIGEAKGFLKLLHLQAFDPDVPFTAEELAVKYGYSVDEILKGI